MILGFARFKNRFEKNEKIMKKRSRKSDAKNIERSSKNVIQNGAKNHQKTIHKSIANLIRKKALPMQCGVVLAAAPGGVQSNKTPPEETYINRKKTKGGALNL